MDPLHTTALLKKVETIAANAEGAPHRLLHSLYSAVIHGDMDRFAAFLCDDVELSISGFSPFDGDWRGREEIVRATQHNFDLVSDQKPIIQDIIAEKDSIAVLLRETGVLKTNGQPYSLRGVQWFRIKDGKIYRIEEILAIAR